MWHLVSQLLLDSRFLSLQFHSHLTQQHLNPHSALLYSTGWVFSSPIRSLQNVDSRGGARRNRWAPSLLSALVTLQLKFSKSGESFDNLQFRKQLLETPK